jgi:hypothetical protein
MVTNKRRTVVGMAWILTGAASAGCGSRTLVITQDRIINTANPLDYNKPAAERRGETLEVSIVCVTADDVAKPGPYQKLAPATFSMTSKDFYTDEFANVSRTKLTVVGAKQDGKETVKKSFDFPSKKLFDKGSVIYVFARFQGPQQEILPVAPVVFHPPGAYRGTLYVHIGARENVTEGDTHGQSIEMVLKRGL